jgi:hypothetical protein
VTLGDIADQVMASGTGSGGGGWGSYSPLDGASGGYNCALEPHSKLMLVAVLCLLAEMIATSNSNGASSSSSSSPPEYLSCLRAGRRLAYIVSDCMTHYEKGANAKDRLLSLRLLALLLQCPYLRHRRGRWYVFCSTLLLPFLVCDGLFVSLLSIFCFLLAFSDTTWSNHHPPSFNQSIINRHDTHTTYYLTGTYACVSTWSTWLVH